jgi:CheY-like chemotaxis protein
MPAIVALPPTGKTVLVVEDNTMLRVVAMRLLRRLGYQPTEADRPAAALEILELEKIDVLFTDVVMPGPIDGIALARQALKRWPDVKVLLTSGFPGTKLDDQIGPHGDPVRFLAKPYRGEDLARLLRDILDD